MTKGALDLTAESDGTGGFRNRHLVVSRGSPIPLGASRSLNGVNFVVISQHASAIWLVLSAPDDATDAVEVPLDPRYNRTGHHWHVWVAGLPDDFCYGYRADGPHGGGDRFDRNRVLIDPTSRALSDGRPWGEPRHQPIRSRIVPGRSGWVLEPSPRTPWEDTILYELHVRGYTVDPSSGVSHPGTFAGLAEKIPYLRWLGVTGVELLPVDAFDELECPFVNPLTGQKLRNYWGYNTVAFASPKASYASDPYGADPWEEFRWLIHAFHNAGIEVIQDVVFNHTGEGNDDGATLHFRGLDNRLYYLLDDQGRYLNFSGCGNTVNSNHPVVRGFVLSCLRSMVAEAGVDGFRFDLAAILGRDLNGHVLVEPPVVEMISEDAMLADTKLIAEPWDAAGLYQVGGFPGGARWSEWNGPYRDDVRRFWRGDPGMTSALATRLCGSDDLYKDRGPLHSINFLTCHDGFTLADLVSYNGKHNEANGEGNRDGNDSNCSWNCGAEGPTTDPVILNLRARQARNLIATLLISQGVPMLLGGDEFLRTQGGNNNAWCQDNEVSWVNWHLAETNADFLRFVRGMIALRLRHPVLRRRTFFGRRDGGPPEIIWHGVEPCQPDFSFESRSLAFSLDGRRCDRHGVIDRDLYVVLNSYYEPLTFHVPASPSGRPWRRAVDTARPSPEDILDLDEGPRVEVGQRYPVTSHSLLILISDA